MTLKSILILFFSIIITGCNGSPLFYENKKRTFTQNSYYINEYNQAYDTKSKINITNKTPDTYKVQAIEKENIEYKNKKLKFMLGEN